MSSKTAKLLVLSAPSGAGKSTLAKMVLERVPGFKLSISHTTRAPRGEEKHGTHYFFVDEKEFHRMIQVGDFLEHALVFGKTWYGTSKRFVETELKTGNHVLFDIDVQGAESLKKAFKDRCTTVFIDPPSVEELEKRLRGRKTESEAAIQTRLITAKKEMQAAESFDHRITNNDLDSAFKELQKILKKEGFQ